MEERLRNIETNLHSVNAFRRDALAAGDANAAAMAEQFILQLEQQTAALTAQIAQREAPEVVPSERDRMGRPHVFALCGDPNFLNIVRELLQEKEYNVTTTNYVPRSFTQIAALQPTLLIVDLVISEEAGWELLERLHAEASTRQIPVIVTSSDQRLLDRAQAEAARFGGQGFVVKPLHLDALLASIRELIGTGGESREAHSRS